MKKKKIITSIISVALLFPSTTLINAHAVSQTSNYETLKLGMRGQAVKELQLKLSDLGYFNYTATGYFGNITRNAVLSAQTALGLKPDGIVGPKTSQTLLSKTINTPVSRGFTSTPLINELSWFNEIKDIIPRGTEFKIIDIATGKSFNVKRTYGTNHSDTETLAKEDTIIMKKIFGNKWSWNRRAIIVEVGNLKLPASMAGMPHGSDFIKDNNMNGHFDVHFLKSKTHGTNRVDPEHQIAIRKAQQFINDKPKSINNKELVNESKLLKDNVTTRDIANPSDNVINTYLLTEDLYKSEDIYIEQNIKYMKSDDKNDVIIDVVFANPFEKTDLTKDNYVFNIYMTTHSYDIDETDLDEKIYIKINNTLIDNSSIKWVPDAPPVGHHISGKIIVPILTDTVNLSNININMTNVAGAVKRSFEWKENDFKL
ncbi:peptidoglycan-binding domain-containing protein [Sporosalibacterium faouarense]|uniref:peptidoglycan-binding domain-containing protein n=1 Tax=Sporosalibacterium faouarense TaxID=516123 RepID=UPI00192C9389|nr:peptidoglycan-binding domain-containing protein [Sporosalibacterium faouarense]